MLMRVHYWHPSPEKKDAASLKLLTAPTVVALPAGTFWDLQLEEKPTFPNSILSIGEAFHTNVCTMYPFAQLWKCPFKE